MTNRVNLAVLADVIAVYSIETLFFYFGKYSVRVQSPIVDSGALVQYRVAAYSIHLVHIFRPI